MRTPIACALLLFAVHLNADILIVAHRGASDYAPENTLPAFELAWKQGADAVEGDFYLTKDGQIVCIHDSSTQRVSEVTKIVKDSTLSELHTIDVGSWFDKSFQGTRIPTLAEVLATVPKGKKIYIEVKCGPEILPQMFKELARSTLERDQIVVISFNEDVIRELKKKDPGIKAYWLKSFTRDSATGELNPTLNSALEILKTIKADGISTSYPEIDEKFIREVEKAGFEYHVWTVDHVETAREFKQWGARSITTNIPKYMVNYLDKPMPPIEAKSDEPAYSPYARMPLRERIIETKARRGPHYSSRLNLFMTSDYQKGGIVFIGDSITEGFPLNESIKDKNVINCGISGDRIKGIAERLDVCVKDLEPKEVYVMIGVNDILQENRESIEELGERYKRLIRDLKRTAPDAKITFFSILPMRGSYATRNHLVHKLNAVIKEIVEKEGLRYFDLHPYFANDKKELYAYLTTDGLHLSPDGYLVWLKAILDKDEFIEAAINFSGYWLTKYGGSFRVAKIDPPANGAYPGSRGPNELVIYTPAYEKSSTNTNTWGTEVIVRNSKVEKRTHFDTPIPSDGFVVSGHGSASQWIEKYLDPGVSVEYDQNAIYIKDIPESQMTPEQRLWYLKKCIFRVLHSMKKPGADEKTKNTALKLLEKIQRIQADEKLSGSDLDSELLLFE